MTPALRACCGLLFAALAGSPAAAVTVRTWGPASADGFARGTLEGTAIDAEGWLGLAPVTATWWGPGQGIVWDLAADGERGVFVALSGPARVLRVAPGKAAETWYEESGDAMVTALAPDGRGGVLFAVSPGGRIFHARGAGQAETEVTTEARYVWALALEGDRLWVGTADPGSLLRRRGKGSLETIATTGEDPVRSLAVRPGGGVVVGTGRRGRVLQVAPDGSVFALLDADEDEIVDVASGEGGILWALAARDRGRARPVRGATEEPARPGAEGTEARPAPPEDPDVPEDTPAPPSEDARPAPPRIPTRPAVPPAATSSAATGALYRIAADGGVTRVWETTTETPYAVALVSGVPMVGTGESGRLLRIDRDGGAAALWRFPSDQVTALAVTGAGRLLAAGSNDARVAALGPDIGTSGTWLSDVFDAGAVSDWGAVRWDGKAAGGVAVSVRVGNTSEPDETWSPWRAVRSGPGAEGATAPAARFAQVRLELKATGAERPRVRRLEVAYRTQNRAPRIRRFEVETPGLALVSQPVPSAPGSGPLVADDPVAQRIARSAGRRASGTMRRLYEAGARSALWDASDPDEDTVRYRLELRAVGQEHWLELARDVETPFFSWDSRGTPDGVYELRLTADDGEDNPEGSARSDVRVSDPFTVDHTPPRLEDVRVSGDRKRVTFTAVDRGGRVAAVEGAQGAGPWRRLSPEDGIEDGEREEYSVGLPAGEPLRLRVTDAAGNLGGAETVGR